MQLRSASGVIKIKVWYGLDPGSGCWGCPVRQRWGLEAHQEMSPALEERLAFTVTATLSYELAAAVARKHNCPADDSTLHCLTQRVGARAEQQMQERLQSAPKLLNAQAAPKELALFMLDGWHLRYRGPGFGKKRTKKKRVEWHELKTGVFYFHEQSGRTEGGRGMVTQKVVVCWQGEGIELGRRLHWEALRRGLGQAKWILVVADGAPWIWNVAADRWAKAEQLLDFWHASEHVWELGRALYGEQGAKAWVEERLHELRHGQEQKFLAAISRLRPRRGKVGKTIAEEKSYFANQAQRMNYDAIHQRGWPIGSGPVESACGGKQNRFKRRGQFWTSPGVRHLEALIEARENDHWDQLWFAA
jgi:hypothetical protein